MKHWIHTVLEEAFWLTKSRPSHITNGMKRIVQLVEEMPVHPFRTIELERVADDLSECTDLNQLSKLMWQAATSTGFQHFAIFVIRQGSNGALKSRICTSYHQAWIERYHAKSYQYVDPVIAEASRTDGWFLYEHLQNDSPLVRSFWEDARQHSIGDNGICFAQTRRDGARLGIVFATSNTAEKTRELVRLNGYDLEFLASLAADCFCHASFGPELSDDTLSIEELKFLYTLASNPNPKEALAIRSSYGSNNALQSSIRSKLCVDTVFQAISIASAKRWFDLLPYDTKEVTRSFPELLGLDFVGLELVHDESEQDA